MQRPITGFKRDEAGNWTARLSCGHRQRIRHNPLFVNQASAQPVEAKQRARHLAGSRETDDCRSLPDRAGADLGARPRHRWHMGRRVRGRPRGGRQRLDEDLIRACDRNHGAMLPAGISDKWKQTLSRMRWLPACTVPVLVKPITRFDEACTALWDRLARQFDLVVRRYAMCLNWRYVEPPHVRYSAVALKRDGELQGVRCLPVLAGTAGPSDAADQLPRGSGRLGPQDTAAVGGCAAQTEDADKIRCYVMHDTDRRALRRNGYFGVRSNLHVGVKLNSLTVPAGFYENTSEWHVTSGGAVR